MMKDSVLHHVLSVQEEFRIHLKLLGVTIHRKSNVIIHLSLAIPR